MENMQGLVQKFGKSPRGYQEWMEKAVLYLLWKHDTNKNEFNGVEILKAVFFLFAQQFCESMMSFEEEFPN